MKIELLAVISFFIPATLMAQAPAIRSPATVGASSIEQPAPRMPINTTLGMGEHPQTLQFAVHPGTIQHVENSAPVVPAEVGKASPEPMPASQILNQLDAKKGDITNLEGVNERSPLPQR